MRLFENKNSHHSSHHFKFLGYIKSQRTPLLLTIAYVLLPPILGSQLQYTDHPFEAAIINVSIHRAQESLNGNDKTDTVVYHQMI